MCMYYTDEALNKKAMYVFYALFPLLSSFLLHFSGESLYLGFLYLFIYLNFEIRPVCRPRKQERCQINLKLLLSCSTVDILLKKNKNKMK